MAKWFGWNKNKEGIGEQNKVAAIQQELNAKMLRRAQLANEIEKQTEQLDNVVKASLNASSYAENVYEDQYNLISVDIEAKKNEFVSLGNDLQVLRDQLLVLNTPISDSVQFDMEEIERAADKIEMKIAQIKEMSAASRSIAERTRRAHLTLAQNTETRADSDFAMAQLEMIARDRMAEQPVKESPFKRAQAQARADEVKSAADTAAAKAEASSVKTVFPPTPPLGENIESILREAERGGPKVNHASAHPVMNDVESLLKEADRSRMKLNLGVLPMSVKMADSYILNMNNCDNAGKGA